MPALPSCPRHAPRLNGFKAGLHKPPFPTPTGRTPAPRLRDDPALTAAIKTQNAAASMLIIADRLDR